jgi:hypothetical protein
MNNYAINNHGVKALFTELKKILPKEQAAEMHHALYRRGLKEWFKSAWLLEVADKLQDAALEHDSGEVNVEIRWFNPHYGVAQIWADSTWFDVSEIQEGENHD